MNSREGDVSRLVERGRPNAGDQLRRDSYILRPFRDRILSGLVVANDVIKRQRAAQIARDSEPVRPKSRY
jgi:hypothetical protein